MTWCIDVAELRKLENAERRIIDVALAGQSIPERVRSIMTNACVLRGSSESKASNLLRLLEEHGLQVVERET